MEEADYEPILLTDLLELFENHLEESNYPKATRWNYRSVTNRLKELHAEKGEAFYDRGIVEEFLQGDLPPFDGFGKMYFRTCRILEDLSRGVEPRLHYRRVREQEKHPDGLEDALSWFLHTFEIAGLKESSIEAYRSRVRKFHEHLISEGVDTPYGITTEIVEGYCKSLGEECCSDATRTNNLRTLRAYLAFLERTLSLEGNPSALLQRIPDAREQKLPSVYTAEELRSAIAAVDRRTPAGKRDYALLLLLATLGPRSIDVSQLSWEDIRFRRKEITFRQSKTEKPVVLHMTDELISAVYELLNAREHRSRYLFTRLGQSKQDKPLSPSAVSHIVSSYLKSSGCQIGSRKSGSHALRHSVATSMTNDGVGMPVVASVLGHASVESLKPYAKVGVDLLRPLALGVPPYEG